MERRGQSLSTEIARAVSALYRQFRCFTELTNSE